MVEGRVPYDLCDDKLLRVSPPDTSEQCHQLHSYSQHFTFPTVLRSVQTLFPLDLSTLTPVIFKTRDQSVLYHHLIVTSHRFKSSPGHLRFQVSTRVHQYCIPIRVVTGYVRRRLEVSFLRPSVSQCVIKFVPSSNRPTVLVGGNQT
jgi:hypothetical protein